MAKRVRALNSDSDSDGFQPMPRRARRGGDDVSKNTGGRRDVNRADEIDAEEDGHSNAEESFPVTLKTRKQAKESEDEYHESSSSSARSSSLDSEEAELEQLSTDGFIVDSDDNVVHRSNRKRRRSMRILRRNNRSLRRSRVPQKTVKSDSDDEVSEQPIGSDEDDSDDVRSVVQELRELQSPTQQRVDRELRNLRPVNYYIPPPPTLEEIESQAKSTQPKTRARNQEPLRRLFSVQGPFGGSDVISIFNPREDDLLKIISEPSLVHTANVVTGSNQSTADTDSLGVATDIGFDSVGGLDEYIDKLKEMVSLPLMYPEVYRRFHITPPRGVLFHGPPGTGKTLMARALAASCQREGKKITFFMRKGADCLSKWIGEAERQLKLLFEEAKAKQPSIIFFDEIDGLAPVRSSKQEQIHASIVSTLLALMDGMDNRGQVVVIGATNRPDSVDPALRRPGRFDREFHFPLPNSEGRRRIIEIHTRNWEPPLPSDFLNNVASMTKGYGGADLRALCTEAALTAIQKTYPQIYSSSSKLSIDVAAIHVTPRDFEEAMERIVPASVRSAASAPAPLPERIEPLLRSFAIKLNKYLDRLLPLQKPLTTLEKAIYCDVDSSVDRRVKSLQTARVHRPRLLVHGAYGMGQEYVPMVVMHHLEGVYAQTLDMAAIYGDSLRTPEATIVQFVVEARRRAPSVLVIPNLELWHSTISPQLQSTFESVLQSLLPTDKVLVVGIASGSYDSMDPEFLHCLGFSKPNTLEIELDRSISALRSFFQPLKSAIASEPTELSEIHERPQRHLEKLAVVEEDALEAVNSHSLVTTEQQRQQDIKIRSQLKVKLGSLMELFRNKYRRFRKPVVDELPLAYLFETMPPTIDVEYVRTDDDMIMELATGKKYYNMDLDTIEDRLWNGYYCEPRQFLDDVQMIHHDSVVFGDRDRIHKSSELLANAQVAIDDINDPIFLQGCHELRVRMAREALAKLGTREKGESTEEVAKSVPGPPEDIEVKNDTVMADEGNQVQLAVAFNENIPVAPAKVSPEKFSCSELHSSNPPDPVVNGGGNQLKEAKIQEKTKSDQKDPNSTLLHPPFVLPLDQLNTFFDRACGVSQQLTLEQLEQLYALIADVIWAHRLEWNRSAMLSSLESSLTSAMLTFV